jgi:hypothetical protein
VGDPVNALASVAKGQEGGFMQQALKVHFVSLADQLHIEGVERADRFLTHKGEHLKIMLEPLDDQAEMGLVG